MTRNLNEIVMHEFGFCIEKDARIEPRSQIHEHTILLRFLDIILRVLRLEVSVWIS
jgi:hypothetical protein